EKLDLYEGMDEEFRKIFEKFSFIDVAASETAGVRFEVLCAVKKTVKVEEVAHEIIAAARDVQEKTEIYAPFNILPLDSAGASQPIMQLEEA
ncbi:callose synthase 5-like protein, partial [Trifolium pratense]